MYKLAVENFIPEKRSYLLHSTRQRDLAFSLKRTRIRLSFVVTSQLYWLRISLGHYICLFISKNIMLS